MFRMLRVGDRLEQMVVARGAAAVVRRAGAGAGEAGDRLGRGAGQKFFYKHVMLPAVTEVILVDQPVLGSMQQIAEPELSFIMALGVRSEELREPILGGIGLIGILRQAEGMQVAVGPAKGQLQHGVELGQFDRGGDEEPSPDGRPEVEQSDL